MEHRSSTRTRHLTLFCAVPFASFHVRCFLPKSAVLVHRQVCGGLPLFRFHCGFHSSALLITCPSGPLSVWPIHPQALCLISCSISRCPVCLQSSLLLPQLLIDEHLLLLLQSPSQPPSFTTFTFDPKPLRLVLVVSAVDRHIGHSIANACLASPIHA